MRFALSRFQPPICTVKGVPSAKWLPYKQLKSLEEKLGGRNKNQSTERVAGMRVIWFTAGFFILCFIGGALIAPWAWWAVRGSEDITGLDILSFLYEHDDFHRYVSRCILGAALLGLWPLMKLTRRGDWYDLGFAANGIEKYNLLRGFALGIGSILIVALLSVFFSTMTWKTHSASVWAKHLLNAGIAMLVVSILEELLFRGVLFGNLRRAMPWQGAAILASLVFATVHFLGAKPSNPEVIHWHSGVTIFGHMFSFDGYWLSKYLNIFLAGVILCSLYQRTNNLYCSIACHAAWIFGGKTLMFIADYRTVIDHMNKLFWGDKNFIEGSVIAVLLLGLAYYYFYYLDSKQKDGMETADRF